MDGRIQIFPASLSVIVLLSALLASGGVRGDACNDKTQACQVNVSTAANGVDLSSANSPNVTAIVQQCQVTQQVITACEAEMRSLCNANSDLNSTLDYFHSLYASVCSPEMLCHLRLRECAMPPSAVQEITGLLAQTPPDAQLIKEKCSAHNATWTVCLEPLETDCSDVANFASSIESEKSVFDDVCGQASLCHAQLSKCTTLAGSGHPSRVCSSSVQQAIRDCLDAIDPVCQSLPQIKSVVDSARTALSRCSDYKSTTDSCPQLWECMTSRPSEINEQCSWPGSAFGCVAKLKGTCPVKEDYMSLQELTALGNQFCQEISNASDGFDCEVMGPCVFESELMRKLASNSTSLQIRTSLLLDSQTWCKYLELTAGCVMKSNSSCQMDAGLLSYMTRQHSYLKTACYSSASDVKGALWNSILVLLLAVLITWSQSFL